MSLFRDPIFFAALLSLALVGCTGADATAPEQLETPAPETAPPDAPVPAALPASAESIVAAPDRSPEDRALDDGRHAAEFLTLYDVKPGMKVGELMSGGGYTVELLARAVGSEGTVYGVNSPFILDRFAAEPWAARLAKPVNANVKRLDREFDAPFPAEVTGLDRVFSVLVYHDFVWMETDRAVMNANILKALKPGGLYVVIDHSAAEGAGERDVKTLHRGDEAAIRAEIEAAGFEFVSSSDFLRNPADDRTWSASPGAAGDKRGTSDRFALTFKKP